MISRIRPLNLNVTFEDRPYKLGETVNLVVELDARGDAEVREGRVDLVCEERYTEVYVRQFPATHGLAGRGSMGPSVRIPGYSKQVTERHRDTYVHSSVTFLKDTRLQSGTPAVFNVKLEIQLDPPPHATKGTVKWELVTSVDVAKARDVTKKHAIKVGLT